MKHCNACGADAETSTESGWMRFDLGGLDVSGTSTSLTATVPATEVHATTRLTAIVPAIEMYACPKHTTTVLAQFNRQRSQRESWLRSWLDQNVPTRIETIE